MNLAGVLFKPLVAAVADYNIEVSPYGTQFIIYQSRRVYAYLYDTVTKIWSLNTTINLTPVVGSTVYWLTYSPLGDIFYHSKGNTIVQKRYTSNYSVI